MKRVLLGLLLLPALCFADVTQNIIKPSGWEGVNTPTSILYASGGKVGYNPSTNTLLFTNTGASTNNFIGINTALSGTGITVSGYNYSWDIHNSSPYQGVLEGYVRVTKTDNSLVGRWTYTYNPMAAGPLSEGFTRFTGTETFSNPYALGDLKYLEVTWYGYATQDTRAIYAGPRVRNQSITLNYTVDPCVVDPLSNPTCPGYATAFTQQCTTNPLYNASCPGYAAAYLTQQCTISALYSPTCPGYTTAFTQQCTANPLYNSSCPGYAAAYQTQQCTINPLFDPTCPGYSTAYLTQQCSTNPLYDPSCPGYATAFTQQCAANPLYNSSCPGYAPAYLTQQCTANPLYDPTCPGYAAAYQTQQCTINPLYSTSCSGYAAAYLTQQCAANALYDPSCPGYAVAYQTQQCNANPLYSTSCPGYASAYFTQQCTANPLYDSSCSGYGAAYFTQQCNANPLTDTRCPGYAAAYQTQQCNANPLYSTNCPGYAAAYQTQQCNANSLYNSSCPGYTAEVLKVTRRAAPVVADAYVAEELYPPAVTTDPARAAIAAVPLVGRQPDALVDYELTIATHEVIPARSARTTTSTPNYNPTTVREALEENNRIKRKQASIMRGNQSINSLGLATDLEEQKAAQSDIIEAMDDDPRLEAYRKKRIQDARGYPQYVVYGNQRNVDNKQLGRRLFGPNQRLHEEMVESQYNR